ncbi:MAG: tetraacyldisaccharide 4'-kinase [Planctomycetota bacterium]
MNQHSYRKLIAGEKGSLFRGLLRFFLWCFCFIYRYVIGLRNLFYDKGWLRTFHVDATVISVGNITVGGTGKTPVVIWVGKLLAQRSIPFAVLTRGYKTRRGRYDDEPAIIGRSCPQGRLIVNANRVAGAQKAIREYGSKVLLMDDGFQHRRLRRNLDIVTIDATCPFGFGYLLPRGLLREPAESLKRAHAVIITRCDQTSPARLDQLERRIKHLNPDTAIARSVHAPISVKMLRGEYSIEQLREKKIYAFCGVGNPDSFFAGLRKLKLDIVGSRVYNDHYQYRDADIRDILEEALYLGADLTLTTQKDWVKTALLATKQREITLAYVKVKLEFIAGEDKIIEMIDATLNAL